MKRRKLIMWLTAFTILMASLSTIVFVFSSSRDEQILDMAAFAILILIVDAVIYRYFLTRFSEHALRRSQERYDLAAQGANEGIWDWDLTSDHIFLSEQWKAYLGYQDEEIGPDSRYWLELIHPEDVAQFKSDLQDHLEGRSPKFTNEHRIRKKNGEYTWIFCRGAAVYKRNKPYRVVGSQIDISERKKKEEELIFQASHDLLTGLPNRSVLMAHMISLLDRPLEQRVGSAALLLMDLDGFKDVNDQHGHDTGDQLLSLLARRLELCTRKSDMVSRLGGDEFAFLVETTCPVGKVTAVQLAGRILQQVEMPFEVNGNKFKLSASIGIAVFDNDYKQPDEWLHAADKALYHAKAKGKARFEFNSAATVQPVG